MGLVIGRRAIIQILSGQISRDLAWILAIMYFLRSSLIYSEWKCSECTSCTICAYLCSSSFSRCWYLDSLNCRISLRSIMKRSISHSSNTPCKGSLNSADRRHSSLNNSFELIYSDYTVLFQDLTTYLANLSMRLLSSMHTLTYFPGTFTYFPGTLAYFLARFSSIPALPCFLVGFNSSLDTLIQSLTIRNSRGLVLFIAWDIDYSISFWMCLRYLFRYKVFVFSCLGKC